MSLWDERYSRDDYIFGKMPNDFLVQVAPRLPAGGVLCLADGEGRNGVFLAEQGFEVSSVDQSAVGLAKAEALAASRGVRLETLQADLAGFDLGLESWEGIVSIFCHLPPELRRALHRKVVAGLKPGGVFVLEAYRPEQLGRGTGGPPDARLMVSLKDLKEELAGLRFEHAAEFEREVNEGPFHHGNAAVVQVVASKVGVQNG